MAGWTNLLRLMRSLLLGRCNEMSDFQFQTHSEGAGAGGDMLVGVRDLPAFQEMAVLRVYDLILSWPCPVCGEAFPCPCDTAPLTEDDCEHLFKCGIMVPESKMGRAGVGTTHAALEPVRLSGSGP